MTATMMIMMKTLSLTLAVVGMAVEGHSFDSSRQGKSKNRIPTWSKL